jgi:predicted RNA-binding protein with PIN domain
MTIPLTSDHLARLRLVVDGYNLMFVSGLMGKIRSADDLGRSRSRLLEKMSALLAPELALRTAVVFDAPRSHRSLAEEISNYGSLVVLIAKHHAEADDLIEELIAKHPQPRRLTVVSGDQRIRIAARRRRAKDIDSETWWSNLERDETIGQAPDALPIDNKPPIDDDTDWLKIFGE